MTQNISSALGCYSTDWLHSGYRSQRTGLGEGRGMFTAGWSHHCKHDLFRHPGPCSGWKKWPFQKFASVTPLSSSQWLQVFIVCPTVVWVLDEWGGRVGAPCVVRASLLSGTHRDAGLFNTMEPPTSPEVCPMSVTRRALSKLQLPRLCAA